MPYTIISIICIKSSLLIREIIAKIIAIILIISIIVRADPFPLKDPETMTNYP
jgi:hypothetical protein